jgi:proteasome lid subunit RPN8/RPN11
LTRPDQQVKLDSRAEAHLIALVCSEVPGGRDHWPLWLLVDKLVELGAVESISPETIRQAMKKNDLKPWQKRQWCISQVEAEFVAATEDALDLHAEPYDPARPTVCFDETSKQLIVETRRALSARPGQIARYDYEYERHGTRNLIMFFELGAGYRHVRATERRTHQDLAHCMQWLVDEAYPNAEVIRVVLEYLNTHTVAALHTFTAAEANRLRHRLEFHSTPKHGSWLNMAEIEFGIFARLAWLGYVPENRRRNRTCKPLKTNAMRLTPLSTGFFHLKTPASSCIAFICLFQID